MFNHKEFDEKVKKAVEAINAMSKSMEETEKAAEEAKKKAQEALKENLNKKAAVDPYNSVTQPYTSSDYWAQLYDVNNNTIYPKSDWIKQEFGSYTHPWNETLDWQESIDSEFNNQLVQTITVIFSDTNADAKQTLQGKKGKVGECYIFTKDAYKSKFGNAGKAYVWSDYQQTWFKVPYEMVIDHWNGLMNKKSNLYDNWSTLGSANYYQPSYNTNKITMKDISNSTKFSGPEYSWGALDEEPITIKSFQGEVKVKLTPIYSPPNALKEYYTKVVKKQVIQKTKPSNPKEGTIWTSPVTDAWTLYTGGVWIGLQQVDKELCQEILDVGKGPQKKSSVPKSSGSGLYFRANCSKWHEVVNPEKTIIKSVNGNYQWFMSNESADKEYSCQHDSKRIMPVFTEKEKENVVKEISAKQNGNIDDSYYIQAGTGKNANWSEIPAKQTITVGGRAFHHNSGNKTWYMCLTFAEMKFAKLSNSDLTSAPWILDQENIFQDAFPVGKHGFAWFYDGTQESKASTAEQLKEQILEEVQIIANTLDYEAQYGNGTGKKKQPKDLKEPNHLSDYQLDEDDINSHMMPFDHIYDGMYAFQQLKTKANTIHKYLMHDLKVAMYKKNKKKFAFYNIALDKLQLKFQEAEQFHISQNPGTGMYLKPISKVHNLFGYHFENDYGVPKE